MSILPGCRKAALTARSVISLNMIRWVLALATLYPFARDSGSHEALALELPYPPFDLERHEKRGGPSGRQSAPFDDLVYANGFPSDNSQQEKAFVIACFLIFGMPFSMLIVDETVRATRVRRDSQWLHLVAEAERKLGDHVLPSLHEARAVLDEARGAPDHAAG